MFTSNHKRKGDKKRLLKALKQKAKETKSLLAYQLTYTKYAISPSVKFKSLRSGLDFLCFYKWRGVCSLRDTNTRKTPFLRTNSRYPVVSLVVPTQDTPPFSHTKYKINQPINLSTYQLINSKTHQLINYSQTELLLENCC